VCVCLLDALATTAEMQDYLISGNSMHRASVFCSNAIKQNKRSARSDVMTARDAGKME